ncbi:glycoside hydrolase 5 family protein [Microbulbifer halophilus]|uniref:mannan endo-1,4-beta-mannosidase n=2 Tax=Microbulbifer halophilus TaxID=453963 RepID=A0ABW5EBY8_9GAMM|nr:mannanase [Microbulbifer halophilus]MCW8126420.1 mannanase [Microbulbifer halophilus]
MTIKQLLSFTAGLLLAGKLLAAAPAEFVQVEDGHFTLGGAPYRFAGANYWHGGYLAATDPERLERELDLLREKKITNLRVLALSESSAQSRSVSPTVIRAPGQFDETLQKGLDRLLVELRERDMKAVLYLTNFWQWSGGMTQYLAWHKDTEIIDPDLSGEWDAYMDSAADFYRCPPCQRQYLDATRTLTGRKNTLNGVRYRDDPTIMAWQLANEPRPGGSSFQADKAQDYIDWVQGSAGAIEKMAPRQLVSSGSEGIFGSQERRSVYVDAHDTPAIDYLTVHLWIKNWGWFDIQNAEETFPGALEKSRDYLQRHIEIAGDLKKPLVLEEFGVERDGGNFSPRSSTDYRDAFLREIYGVIERNSREGGPLVGSNIWTFGGYGRNGNDDYRWRPGDDFLGDPPQEAQGLNSVFDTDTETLGIIRAHAQALRADDAVSGKQ